MCDFNLSEFLADVKELGFVRNTKDEYDVSDVVITEYENNPYLAVVTKILKGNKYRVMFMDEYYADELNLFHRKAK